jgi:hypothetical protein
MFLRKVEIAAAALFGLGALTATVGSIAAPPADDTPHGVVRLRVPNRGIQPQVAVDSEGIVHLLSFKGDPYAGDVFYTRTRDGVAFDAPLRVNSVAGSAVAVGNIRGAHLALGKNGRPHVAWNGSHRATPKAPGDPQGPAWMLTPMLYTRLNDAGSAFEPQRNVIHSAPGLDGGGSVAADGAGNVFVFWHAPDPGKRGEDNRRVWVAVSTDGGKTFAPEKAAYTEPTGACGCCGMRAFADRKGTVYALYRGARDVRQRDMYLLTSADKGKTFRGEDVHPWSIDTCPMSSETFAERPEGLVVAAWETKGQVYFARIDPKTGKTSAPAAPPGEGRGRKHPAVAVNGKGEMILAWTEGMGWERGGSVAWQVYDRDGNPTEERGQADGVRVWSLVAVFARPDGRFTVVY